jgi:polysaccharide pyruvyl transferase WcaK-like protein
LNILLINDNSAHVNWGAQASPSALVGIIEQSLSGCTITALSHAWLARSHHRRMHHLLGGRLIRGKKRGRIARKFLNRCSTLEAFYPEVADDFDYWADEWLAGRGGPQANEFLKLAEKAEIIVYNGENSIYRNTPEGCHGIFLLWLAKTRLGKPVCIVNHTSHQNGVRPIMTGMIQLVFPDLDLVAVREPCSLANLRALGIRNAELFPDVVFSLLPGDYSRDRVDQWRHQHNLVDHSYFCLSASGLPVSKPQGGWDGEVAALVRNLKTHNLQAVLIAKDPWCLFLYEVARQTDSLFFGPEHEFHDLWPLLEGASFLVTGHYHYVIFGTMVGCPFVPMSVNNHKMQGVCELLEWERTQPFDATYLKNCRAEIVSEAWQLMDNRSELSARLVNKVAQLRDDTLKLGAGIACQLNDSGKSQP